MTTAELISAAAILVDTSADYTADEFEAVLAEFVDAAENKITALRVICKAAEGRAASLQAEADAYAAAARSHKATAARVKGRAFELMEAAEATGEQLAGARLQPNGGRVPLIYSADFAVGDLPIAYQRVTVAPDVEALTLALERGEEIAGVSMGERGRHLRWTEGK